MVHLVPVESVPWVHFVDWNVQTSRDVFNSLVALRDDAHTLSDGLGCDWVITCHHDNLQGENRLVKKVFSHPLK